MTKLLNLDEMLDCAKEIGLPQADIWAGELETIGSTMAAAIADKLGVIAGDASAEGVAFAGTCAPFNPAFEGQPCPDALDQFDPDGDWSTGGATDEGDGENA
ncbi:MULTISPECIES: hypothetical protein [Microvirga]|uniref:hypothetical protein n=1 Tax=Microvirga TaxID=186650 RepID=UPI0021C706E2|nr:MULTISPECIES: hypothetical protein [unclassified Microvirga]